jgi:hypothetical protein
MSISDRESDTIYDVTGRPMYTAWRMEMMDGQPPCAYCAEESTRACDTATSAPRQGRHGWCARAFCERHAMRLGKHHDLCRELATGDNSAFDNRSILGTALR